MLETIIRSFRKYAVAATFAAQALTGGCTTPGEGNPLKPVQNNPYSEIVFEDVASELSLYDNNSTVDSNSQDCSNSEKRSYYPDNDGDGFGLKAGAVYGCIQPQGYVPAEKALDCNDNPTDPLAPYIHPGAAEVCDGLDNDCDGKTDEAPNGEKLRLHFYDGPVGTSGVGVCEPGIKMCLNGVWQITAEPVKPTAEICDSLDNDCDGQTDTIFQDEPLDIYIAIQDSDSIRAVDPESLRFLASKAMIDSAGENFYGNPSIFAFAGWSYNNFVADKDLLSDRIDYLKDSYASDSLGESADLDFGLRIGIDSLISYSASDHKKVILLIADGNNVHPEEDQRTTADVRQAALENNVKIYGIYLDHNSQGDEFYFQQATDGYLRVNHNGAQDDGKVFDTFEEMGSMLSAGTEYRCNFEGNFVEVPLFNSNHEE